jgi:hypothetical protein
MKVYLTKCSCGRLTSKAYARKNAGLCKSCVTGVDQPSQASQDRREADRAFREDHMGCSEDVMEGRYCQGGD